MKLWSGVLSNNAAKVRILLAEKGVDCEILEVPWTREHFWEPKPKGLWDANPRGQVPVLIDGDLTLYDSTVINEYLEEKYPVPALMPADLQARAKCRLMEDEGDHNQLHVGVLIQEVFLAAQDAGVSDQAAEAIAALQGFYGRLAEQLDEKEYLCGDFSIADISVFLTLAFAGTLGAEISQPNLKSWFDRMLGRPAVVREYEQIMAAAAAA